MERINFKNTEITGGFWKKKQDMVRKTTVYAVYDRFVETGRFDAFKFDWKEGMPLRPHYFWDSDVAKWIESASYILAKHRDAKLEKIIDKTVDLIAKNQGADGYFNIYFTVVEPEARFTDRSKHELYCAGHLIEAAVAYYEATGKRKFLDAMIRCADYIYERFYVKKDTPFATPGHEEIELALVKLHKCTGDEKYLTLSKYFIDERGKENEPNNQSHLPVRDQTEAVGHCVRAGYLYSGMADVAKLTGDEELKRACEAIFDDIVNKKMYVTGGIGSTSSGEAFTAPYDLPNLVAYSESCAAIALAFFASRMLDLDVDSKYSDVIERVIYNGFMSSTSLDGKSFFYVNPLEIIPYLPSRENGTGYGRSMRFPDTRRKEVFSCSCCPPNVVRFIPSIADLLYSDDGETLYVHQYMQSKTTLSRGSATLKISQTTRYPESGRVKIKVEGGSTKVAVRVPFWCEKKFDTVKGYAYFSVKDGETLTLDFGMPTRLIEAKSDVVLDCGKYAVMRGPVVYCMEGVDNECHLRDVRIDSRAAFKVGKDETLEVPTLTVRAYRREDDENAPLYSVMRRKFVAFDAKFIPYYAFANRGESEMTVWVNIK